MKWGHTMKWGHEMGSHLTIQQLGQMNWVHISQFNNLRTCFIRAFSTRSCANRPFVSFGIGRHHAVGNGSEMTNDAFSFFFGFPPCVRGLAMKVVAREEPVRARYSAIAIPARCRRWVVNCLSTRNSGKIDVARQAGVPGAAQQREEMSAFGLTRPPANQDDQSRKRLFL
jgi:hypothetical protein